LRQITDTGTPRSADLLCAPASGPSIIGVHLCSFVVSHQTSEIRGGAKRLDSSSFRKDSARKSDGFVLMNNVSLRLYRTADLAAIKKLTIDSFAGVTIEENVEQALGVLNGHDWRWRKARHLDEDAAANAAGIFVAEAQNRVVGYITTRIDREAGKGRIPNLAVAAEFRGEGLGRLLIERALEYFRAEGLVYAVIETMAQNAVGQHLYPACGFAEIARQAHFARKL
jgi:ribosomal protein S18 acetylase RimI-like enzyme